MDISYCGDKTGFPRPGHIYNKANKSKNPKSILFIVFL